MSLEDEVLERVTPDTKERERVRATSAALVAATGDALAAGGWKGRATVQGSIAKDTWLSGATDVDCFLLLDPALPQEALQRVAMDVGRRVLHAPRHRYAQHPYVVGEFQGMQVDMVPAYAVQTASARMSAVDRTPFHTDWVREHLDDTARRQVRLLKAWCRGVGVYGAETAVGGMSGYLLEVLVHHFSGFAAVRDWFQAACEPRRIVAAGMDEVEDDVSPLVVVDPVDPARNCAAAVTQDAMDRARDAALAYATSANEAFFFPAPPRPEDPTTLHDALASQNATWVGLLLSPRTDRLDIVLPQFQRVARSVARGLDQAGFRVRRHGVQAFDGEASIGFQFVLDDVDLPATRVHAGPLAKVLPNAERFRKKWQGHPDAAGRVVERDGRLEVTVSVRERTPASWLRSNLDRLATAKHVRAALDKQTRFLDDPAQAPADWAPAVADFVLDRPPWER